MRRALFLALALLACACADTLPNENGTLVDKLRLLAIKAEPPEIAPGGKSLLTPLVLDPKGHGRALTYTWLACDPALDDFNGTACSDATRLADLAKLADDPSVHRLGTGTQATYWAPVNLFYSRDDDDPIRYFGVPAEILLVVSAGSFEEAAAGKVESQVALVRVAVTDLPANMQNANPRIVEAGDFGKPGHPVLEVEPSCDSAQTFIAVDPTSAKGYENSTEALTAS